MKYLRTKVPSNIKKIDEEVSQYKKLSRQKKDQSAVSYCDVKIHPPQPTIIPLCFAFRTTGNLSNKDST